MASTNAPCYDMAVSEGRKERKGRMSVQNELDDMCREVALEWEAASKNDFVFEDSDGNESNLLDDVLDVDLIVNWVCGYSGSKVYVTLGGPAVYIDTTRHCVCGAWGAARSCYYLDDETVDAIDRYFSEFYDVNDLRSR